MSQPAGIIWECVEDGCPFTVPKVGLDDVVNPRDVFRVIAAHYAEAHGEHVADARGQLLTDTEMRAIAATVELVNLMAQVIDHGRTRVGDLDEVIHHVHAIQHAIMSQAAARAYPKMFRRLGQTLDGRQPQ